jgi:hypothetical protein
MRLVNGSAAPIRLVFATVLSLLGSASCLVGSEANLGFALVAAVTYTDDILFMCAGVDCLVRFVPALEPPAMPRREARARRAAAANITPPPAWRISRRNPPMPHAGVRIGEARHPGPPKAAALVAADDLDSESSGPIWGPGTVIASACDACRAMGLECLKAIKLKGPGSVQVLPLRQEQKQVLLHRRHHAGAGRAWRGQAVCAQRGRAVGCRAANAGRSRSCAAGRSRRRQAIG